MNSSQLIQIADDIGRRLYRDAIWHQGRCNWMSIEYHFKGKTINRRHQPMEEDLYKGLSGVALFLGALYHATGEDIFRRAAVGACRQAVRLHERPPGEYRWSFFRGSPGLAWALCQAGAFTREPELQEAARQAVERLLEDNPPQDKADVIDGLAGGIPALIALDRKLEFPALRSRIIGLGEGLLERAVTSPRGIYWANGQEGQPMPGFSHGASGMAWCMLELHRYTGSEKYRQAALATLSFEDQLVVKPEKERHFIKSDWAHGAAGLGLARLNAYVQGGGDPLLESTRRYIEESRQGFAQQRQMEVSACNGVWGLTTLLLAAADELGDPSFKAQALEITEEAVRQYEERGACWWDGNPARGEAPDFMICLSGIGYSLLRLADSRAYPSVLAVRGVS